MSFFDDIRAKAEELLGGAGEQASSSIEDAKGTIDEVSGQVEELKNGVLPGQGDNNEEK